MMQNDIKVIAELNRIVERYGSDSVTRLANLIRDPKRADELATVLEIVAAQNVKPTPKVRNPGNAGTAVLNDLKDKDPQKYTVLADFRERLVSGSILRSLSEVKQFAMLNGLSIGKATSRNATISPLLRSLSELETPAIVALSDSLIDVGGDARSLDRWWEVIVRPKPTSQA